MTSIFSKVGMIFFPPKCYVCDEFVSENGVLCIECWQKLEFINRGGFCIGCGIGFGGIQIESNLCDLCCCEQLPYFESRSVVKYSNAANELVLKLKFYDETHVACFFAKLMFNLCKSAFTGIDVIVPVPMCRKKMMARKYNQAAIIARNLGSLSGLRADFCSLVKIKGTRPQSELNYKKRLQNLRGAFEISGKTDLLRDKKVLLVDDVITTGSTIKECAKTLLKGKVKQVSIISFARALK